MSLRPHQPLPDVPHDTALVVRAAFPKGNPCLTLRDQLGAIITDDLFAALYPERGQPAFAPWRLALITLLQFRENLSDRQAADAVRARIDWKYLLALPLDDPGFDYSVLCAFRRRLLAHDQGEGLFDRLLDVAREAGLLKVRGRARTDATHVLAAVRKLGRLELLGETLRAALNAVATHAPDWLSAWVPEDWFKRYAKRIEEHRLPANAVERDAYGRQVGADGFALLAAVEAADAPAGLNDLAAIEVLRQVWARHVEQVGDNTRLRERRGRGPDGDRIESPYDIDARYRSKSGMHWSGYMTHVTEGCDEDLPHLILHTDTTPGNVHEAKRLGAIHQALHDKALLPAEHLVDAGYISAQHLVEAKARHGIELMGPTRTDPSWQHRQGGFTLGDFILDWTNQRARCPQGHDSVAWDASRSAVRGAYVSVRFASADCAVCPLKARCTKGGSRQLILHRQYEHQALMAARAREQTEEGRALYGKRRGVEGTLSQAVRAFDLRCARYRGLAKTQLQMWLTAAALNLDRLAAWFEGRSLALTRISRFARLATA